MNVMAVSQSAFAVAVVAVLFLVFVLLLFGSLRRARTSARRLAGTREGTGVAAPTAAEVPTAPTPMARRVISRRDFFRGGLLASLGVFTAQFAGATLAFLWPNLAGGFGGLISVPDTADTVMDQIRSTNQPYYLGSGRFYLINYSGTGDKPGEIYDGLTADVGGGRLMALYQKCAHLGCRVPFCQQSQWFECPCHGSKYNYAGEYELGPAPTGLQRFPVKVAGGQIMVDTGNPTAGPPRGTDTIHQAPEGPFCVGGA